MINPLDNIHGDLLRKQSEWLLAYRETSAYKKLNKEGKDCVQGLILFLDEVRSYCHDQNGVDCLLIDPDTKDHGESCDVCHNPLCLG